MDAQQVRSDCVGTSYRGQVNSGNGCQVYDTDIYENWDASGSGAGDTDLWYVRSGGDAWFFYFEIETRLSWDYDASGESRAYQVELDVDAATEANRGDYLLTYQPSRSHQGMTWRVVDQGGDGRVTGYRDANNDVGGAVPLSPEFNCGGCDGYETGFPTTNAVLARIVLRGGKWVVQLAIRASALGSVSSARARMWAGQQGARAAAKFTYHDHRNAQSLNGARLDNSGSADSLDWVQATIQPGPSVLPDGGQNLAQLPSNGVPYTFTFTLVNPRATATTFGLKAFGSAAAAIGVVWVDGSAGDTTTVTVPAGASMVITVQYLVAVAAPGTRDTLWLRASVGSASDVGFAEVTVVRPEILIGKAVAPSGTAPPGADLTYTVTVTNAGSRNAVNVVSVDSLATQLEFKVGSLTSALPAGLTATVQYSNDGGAGWGYAPVSLGCGAPANYDGCVTHIRWTLQNDLGSAAPNNAGSYQYVARVK
jgi:uncharacterized repeat protein (TIGR01451 family)